MRKSEDTKNRIIQCSLELFNEYGPDNVSTVQILKALDISPGNLYYYYRNKEEIIRELYSRLVAEYQQNWNLVEMQKPGFDVSRKIINNLHIFFKYRFLMNHMSALVNNDPLLREEFIRITAQRQSELCIYFQTMEEQGMMDFQHDPVVITRLVSVLWFLGDYWMTNQELRCGKISSLTPEMEAEYLQTNMFLTAQFMTAKGIEAIEV